MFSAKNQKSAFANSQFDNEAVAELLQNRCVQIVMQNPHICSPLSVISNSAGKLRLVLNLRYLNQFLLKNKFKYEDPCFYQETICFPLTLSLGTTM